MTIKAILALAAAAAIAACSGEGNASPFDTRRFDSLRSLSSAAQDDTGTMGARTSPIKHVVFVIQENRSFNNLFMDYPGAKTQEYGFDMRGHKIRLRAQDLGTTWDIRHSAAEFFAQCDGRGELPGTDCKMDGWNKGRQPNAPSNAPYAYVPRNEIAPYWEMAQRYVLADRMFASNLDGSFIAHQYAVAAYASRGVDTPSGASWGCEGGKTDTVPTLLAARTYGPSIRTCFENPTIAGEADAARLSWRFYAAAIEADGGMWSSYQADRKIFNGPDWNADVVSPAARFLSDVASGKLANVTWITPTWETSDHPGLDGHRGPAWVASIVNAIGTSRFWNSTAIFIMWDDWGGWFDPVPPVYEDYDGLGFRVPLIVVSPYAVRGSVTHVQYETASVLRFIEDDFGLAPLAKSDARANDPADDPDVFDYAQPPRPFKKIAGAKPASYWMELERSAPRVAPTPNGDGD